MLTFFSCFIDGITVAVDNEEYGTVYYPDGGLSAIANQNSNFKFGQAWNTRTAPFDKEVRKSLVGSIIARLRLRAFSLENLIFYEKLLHINMTPKTELEPL